MRTNIIKSRKRYKNMVKYYENEQRIKPGLFIAGTAFIKNSN
jgi:hypothetical protein